jgi:hypothetical protein
MSRTSTRTAAMRVRLRLAHALDFDAWRSLSSHGLDDGEIAELMVALVRAAAAPRGKLPT